MPVLLSIIVPVYNSEQFLPSCLGSILSQITDSAVEVICLNDGSSDSSAEILREYSNLYPFMHVFEHSNVGLGATRNKGITRASGKYLMFVDSDDTVLPDAIPALLDICANRNDDLVEFQSEVYNPGRDRRYYFNKFPTVTSVSETVEQYMTGQRQLTITAWSKLWRREFLLKNELLFTENKKFEDVNFSLKAYLRARTISNTDLLVYTYHVRSGSMTRAGIDNRHLQEFYEERVQRQFQYSESDDRPVMRKLLRREIGRAMFDAYRLLWSAAIEGRDRLVWLTRFAVLTIRYLPGFALELSSRMRREDSDTSPRAS